MRDEMEEEGGMRDEMEEEGGRDKALMYVPQ